MSVEKPNYPLRRGLAAAAVLTVAAATGGAAKEAFGSSKTPSHDAEISLTNPDVLHNRMKLGEWDGTIVVQASQSDADPTHFARHLVGGKHDPSGESIQRVKNEIATQSGEFMNAGEWVVVSQDDVNLDLLQPVDQVHKSQITSLTHGNKALAGTTVVEMPIYEFKPDIQS